MNDVMLREFNSDLSDRQYVKQKRFLSNDRKSKKNSLESRPLLTDGCDSSSSDDEITLHDIRQLKYLKTGRDVSQLRNVNKPLTNGRVQSYGNVSDPFRHYDLLDHKVEKDDSLQSLSIKYQCSLCKLKGALDYAAVFFYCAWFYGLCTTTNFKISDLKRANKLIIDQEFYALKHIKIPVKKYSLLTEILPPVHTSRSNSTIVEDVENNVGVINIGIGGRSPSPQDTAAFFKRMDEDLVKIMLNSQSQKDSFDAAAAAFTAPRIQPLVKDPYSSVDYGIQWNYLIICAIVFAVVVPAVIALYLYFRSSHSQSHDVYPSMSDNDSFSTVTKLHIQAES